MKTCLIVIDAQESFRHRPYYTEHDMPAYLSAQNALIEGCAAQGVPIVRIFHVDGPATAANAFAVSQAISKLSRVWQILQLPPLSKKAATVHS